MDISASRLILSESAETCFCDLVEVRLVVIALGHVELATEVNHIVVLYL